jgi:tetratricopeptide (TPR) repeat protein
VNIRLKTRIGVVKIMQSSRAQEREILLTFADVISLVDMKLNHLAAILAICTGIVSCQSGNTKEEKADAENPHLKLFKHARTTGDLGTAAVALNEMLLDDTTYSDWYDTMAVLYYNMGNYQPASWYADKVLAEKPKDLRMLELVAMSEQQLGRPEKVLKAYGDLFNATQDFQYLYQSAAVEFSMGNVDNCRQLVDSILRSPSIDKDSIEIQIENDYSQQVPLRAAVYNLQAFLKARDGNMMGAKNDFEKALRIYPDFILAKRNLQDLLSGGRR